MVKWLIQTMSRLCVLGFFHDIRYTIYEIRENDFDHYFCAGNVYSSHYSA